MIWRPRASNAIYGAAKAGLDALAQGLAAATAGTGVRVLVVNALHERAATFYRRYGLEPSPTNPLDLMITVNDIKASLPPE